MVDRAPTPADVMALLRDLSRNQAQINDTQQLTEETFRKLVDNKISGEQNGHGTNSVSRKVNPHPTHSRPSMLTFPTWAKVTHGGRKPTFEEVQE